MWVDWVIRKLVIHVLAVVESDSTYMDGMDWTGLDLIWMTTSPSQTRAMFLSTRFRFRRSPYLNHINIYYIYTIICLKQFIPIPKISYSSPLLTLPST
jgi:hypothetical protein